MARLIIAAKAIGFRSAEGPHVAGAVVYTTNNDEPIFWNEADRGVKYRYFTEDHTHLTEFYVYQVAQYVRETADSCAVVFASSRDIRLLGLTGAKHWAMAAAVTRAVERATHLQFDKVSQFGPQALVIFVPGNENLSEDYIQKTPVIQNSHDWRIGAAGILAKAAQLDRIERHEFRRKP